MDLSDFQTDETKEEKGAWVRMGDAEFLIAANLNGAHRKALNRLRNGKYAAAVRKGNQRDLDKMSIEAMAEAVLLDWRGNVCVNEKPVTHTVETAIKFLSAKQFRDWVIEQSVTQANFELEKEAADVADMKSGDRVGD